MPNYRYPELSDKHFFIAGDENQFTVYQSKIKYKIDNKKNGKTKNNTFPIDTNINGKDIAISSHLLFTIHSVTYIINSKKVYMFV